MKKTNLISSLLVALVVKSFIFTAGSLAQTAEETEPVYLMEDIVVTSTTRTVPSEITIDSERLRIQSPGSAAELLSGVSGSIVTAGSKNSFEIMIRGFDSDETLVMLDGRPINEPYYGKIDLSTIGLGNISKIKVVKGTTSVRYGPNAMAGVVNIMTSEENGSPFDIRMNGGSGDELRTDITHRGRVHDVGYVVHAGRNTTHGFPLSSDYNSTSYEDGDRRDNSDYSRTDIDAKLLFGAQENPDWRLSLGGSRLEKGLPGSVYDPRYWRFRKWERMSVDLDGEPVRKESFRLKTKFYADRFVNELVDYRDDSYDLSNIYYDSTHDNRSAGFLLSSSYISGANGVTNAGLQVRWDESRRQADTGLDWFLNRTATNWIFAEHERTLTPNLFIRGGVSGELYTYESWKKTTASINPSLFVEWNFRNTYLTGSMSRTSRFPTLNQLFSTTSGNPNLNPEWAMKGELGVSRTFPGSIHLSLTGFMNRVHDMIYRAGKLNKYTNIENASLDGIELSGLIKKDKVEFSSAFTMLDARDDKGDRLVYRPRWKIDLYFTLRILNYTKLYVSSRSVGERRTEVNTYLNSYHIQDTGLLFFEERDISASIRLRNIFDVDYEEEYGYPMAGRTLLAGIDVRWGKTR
ncbi:TonB-dependent receptor plug domain-containing protein [Candidatus Latescibacterota bacterium]